MSWSEMYLPSGLSESYQYNREDTRRYMVRTSIGNIKKKRRFWKTLVIRWEIFIVGGLIWEQTWAWHVARISSEREDVGEHVELNKQLQYPPFSAKIGTDTFRGRYLFWQANSFSRTKLQGPVVRRPISTSLGLNINPAFFISLFKNPF